MKQFGHHFASLVILILTTVFVVAVQVFEPLLRPSPARQLVEHIIGAEYLLSQATGRPAPPASAAEPALRDTQW